MKEVLVHNDYMLLEVEDFEGFPLLHLKVYKWSHTILKSQFYPTWVQVLELLKSRGHKVVLAIYSDKQPKIGKFHSLMGMHEAGRQDGRVVSRRWL